MAKHINSRKPNTVFQNAQEMPAATPGSLEHRGSDSLTESMGESDIS